MLPILFDRFETEFTSNGIGRLSECLTCTVTEERNGIYECEFTYPITGHLYSRLIDPLGAVIGVIHDDRHDIQPFDIYAFSAPMNGIVTFYAHHISYRLSHIIVKPFVATSPASAIEMIQTQTVTDNPFIFWTDKTGGSTMSVNVPKDIRSLLYGEEGSLLDIYGKGEFQFDKFFVRLYKNRGSDTNVTIHYGKNLINITKDYDSSGVFTAIAPYWKGGEDDSIVVTLPEIFVAANSSTYQGYYWTDHNDNIMEDGQGNQITFTGPVFIPIPADFSSVFSEQPTVEELRQAATKYLNDNEPWIPNETIKVDFVQLWQTEEYANVAALQRVSLCDTVSVYYPELGVIADKQKVIKVVYDVILERYSEMELGQSAKSFYENISTDINDIAADLNADFNNALTNAINGLSSDVGDRMREQMTETERLIKYASDLISGGLGGYVVFTLNANGQPEEILIMDTPDVNTAINVIRMNKNGIGFSSTGYSGTYKSAWTITGVFNAEFITAGTMLANRIKGGVLSLGGPSNGNGEIIVYDAIGNIIGRWNNLGAYISGDLILKKDHSDGSLFSGVMTAQLGSISVYYGVNTQNIGALQINFNGQRAGVAINETLTLAPVIHSDYNSGSASTRRSGLISSCGVDIVGYAQATTSRTPGRFVSITPTQTVISSSNENGTGSYISVMSGSSTYNNQSWGEISFSRSENGSTSGGRARIYTGLGTDILTIGTVIASGGKSRVVDTKSYNERLLYCYEMPSPIFGDIGEGFTDESGYCYVSLDDIFNETINTNIEYFVFLQKEGSGDIWVSEKNKNYFIVEGTPNLKFAWEIKCRQLGYEYERLEVPEIRFAEKQTETPELVLIRDLDDYLREMEEALQ